MLKLVHKSIDQVELQLVQVKSKLKTSGDVAREHGHPGHGIVEMVVIHCKS